MIVIFILQIFLPPFISVGMFVKPLFDDLHRAYVNSALRVLSSLALSLNFKRILYLFGRFVAAFSAHLPYGLQLATHTTSTKHAEES